MEPLIIIGVPGLVGGVLVALILARVRIRPSPDAHRPLDPPSPSLINMARIRIDGVGGLGMVAMAIAVAAFVPRIRMTMAISLMLGIALAALLVARRRRSGPLPSSSLHRGAHAMFISDPPSRPR